MKIACLAALSLLSAGASVLPAPASEADTPAGLLRTLYAADPVAFQRPSPTRELDTMPAIRRTARFGLLLSALAGAATPVLAETCQAEVGRTAAARLVQRCLEVSPATRPPCNAANACALIESEIVRGCRIVAEDAPGWCADYAE